MQVLSIHAILFITRWFLEESSQMLLLINVLIRVMFTRATVAFVRVFAFSQSGDHPWEDLAKSGYKPFMKYKTLIILLYFWLHSENRI
jgi:hypothetical protein